MFSMHATVRILPDVPIWHGHTGEIVDINPDADDGNYYGVSFFDIREPHTVYFSEEELEITE